MLIRYGKCAVRPRAEPITSGGGDDADETGEHVLQGGEDCGGWFWAVVEAVDQVA